MSDRDRFCTAVYGTLEARDGRWWFTSAVAGHPRPVLARAGAASILGDHGSLLGVFDPIALRITETALDPGDVVVLYTDGITDLPPPHGRSEADVAGLVATASTARATSAAQITEAIHGSVTDRLPAAQRADDVALVVLRVTDAPAPIEPRHLRDRSGS